MTAQRVGLVRVAEVVQRLAVLLAAGVTPASAWTYLPPSVSGSGADPVPGIARRLAAGVSVPEAIGQELAELGGPGESGKPGEWGRPGESGKASELGKPSRVGELDEDAWRGLAAAWSVATEAGAPLAPTLRDFAGTLRDLAQVQREIRVALAAPRATARLVTALPVVGALFGVALGFNTPGILFATIPGWLCLATGVGLMILAARWNRRLIRSASPREATPGIDLDLMAIAVAGGSSLERARGIVERALGEYSRHGESGGAVDPAIDEVLELSRRAGVPAAELLRSEAAEMRREARAGLQERVESLSVRLMLPLGLCVLPAFMLLGVLPLLLAVIQSTRLAA